MFNLKELKEINFFRDIYNNYTKKYKGIKQDILIYQIIRDSINLMVKDLIQNTLNNLKKNKIKSINDVYSSKEFLVSLSSKYMSIENDIKTFLKSKMYNNSDVVNKNNEGKKIISYLFNKIKDNPKRFLNKAQLNGFIA